RALPSVIAYEARRNKQRRSGGRLPCHFAPMRAGNLGRVRVSRVEALMPVATIGRDMLCEDVRALAGKLGTNADRYAWAFYERTVDELTQTELGQLKVELTETLSQGEKRMSAQTNTGTAAQPQKAAEIPNTEAYSTNFYFDMQVDGHTFAGQMTVRGGLNGP